MTLFVWLLSLMFLRFIHVVGIYASFLFVANIPMYG